MTKEEILAAAGYPNTPDGIAAFYNEYDTPDAFFAKHGGSLSGAPHNGQPTADQFFNYGSHVNDKLNIPMSNPFFLKQGGTYYGGPTRPYAYGGGLPGGANEMPEMLHGGYHSPMNYGSFPAVEWGGALDASNEDAYPMMEDGGLKQFLKSVSKARKKAYKEGGKTTIQGGNQNFLQNRRAAFDDALKNNVYNAFIQEEEKAAMQAMNPYATGMEDQDMEYQARKGKQKEPDDVPVDFRKVLPDLLPVGRDYSQYIPADIQSQYMMSNADYAKMADLNQRLKDKTFNLTNFEGTPEWGAMARLLGKTGRKMFGPKSVTYKFTGKGIKQVPVKDTELNLPGLEKQRQQGATPSQLMNDYYNQGSTEFEDTAGMSTSKLPEEKIPQYKYRNLNLPAAYNEDGYGTEYQDRNYSDQYIQKQSLISPYDNSDFIKDLDYYFKNKIINPNTYLGNMPSANPAYNWTGLSKKYGGILSKYQGGGLTQEQYDELMRMYTAAEQASQSGGKKNQATLDFQRAFHDNPETKKIAERLLQERQAANNPTTLGKTLGAGKMYSLPSNEDSYFGQTTKQYLSELEKLKPQTQPAATPAPVTGTYSQLQDMNVPDTGMNLNFKSPASTPNLAASTKPSTLGTGANLQGPNELDTGISGNLNLASAQGVKPTKDEIRAKNAGMDMKPLQKGKPELTGPTDTEVGPEETIESKVKRKTKGIGKAIGQYAPGAANWLASNLEKKPKLDPMQNQPIVLGNRGDYRDAEGMGEFRPDQQVPVQFPGGIGAYRTKFGGALPQALSGLEIKMQPGLYGTNGNRQFSLPTQIDSQKYAQQPTEVRNSLTAVPRDQANLEAEGGETALVNIDGIPAHFKISGKRHSQGGVPLDLPDNSFIYSDTASMKIKDPNILAQFGMAPKKGGYTPAEIAKKYDINKYRKILSNPNSESLERKTAEAMIANNNMKLAKLAMAQESLKGFPQGIPVVAMPYMMANNIDPTMYMPTQGQEEQPDADMGVQRYGGNIIAQYPTMRYGGLPKAQEGKNKVAQPSYDELYARQNKVLQTIQEIRESQGDDAVPEKLKQQYNNYENLITELYGNTLAQREQFSDQAKAREASKARRKNLGIEEDSEWVSGSGDRFDEEGNLVQEHGYFDPKSVGDYFGRIGKRFSGDMTQFAPPPESGMGVVENPGKKKVKQFISKLNPANAEGVLDYAANIVNYPLYGMNNLLTGQWESTGNLYTDVALDPTTWFGAKPFTAPVQGAKYAGKLVMQYGPEVAAFIQKYGKRGYEIIEKYGKAGVEAVKKYGKKGIDYVVEQAPIVAKKIGEALAKPPVGVYTNIASRGLQGYAQEKEKDKEIGKLQIQNKILEDALLKQASPDNTKVKELTKISPKAELAKKNTVANMQRAEAEYLNTMGALNRFADFKQPTNYQQFASGFPQYERPVVAPAAPVVMQPAPASKPATKNIEVKKTPAAKTKITVQKPKEEEIDWSKYKE